MTKATWSYSRGWRLLSVIVLRPLLVLLIRNKSRCLEHIPKTGGLILRRAARRTI